MPDTDVAAIRSTVVWCAFALGVVLGAITSRTGFCAMGAIADIVNMSDWTRMRMWAFAVGIAILGTQGLAIAGLIDPAKSVHAGRTLNWLSGAIGGLMFGFGMVLASGCGARTLTRIGAGSLKSLVVFVMIALAAYMTLRGLTAGLRVNLLEQVAIAMPVGHDLPRLLAQASGLTLATTRAALGLSIGAILLAWALADREFRRVDPLLGALVTGLIIVAGWFVSGHIGQVDEHPDTLQEAFIASTSGRAESLTFIAPIALSVELLLFWTDTSRLVTLGIATVCGTIAGSFAWAIATRQFRWEGFQGTEDTANHLVGGCLMGMGGVIALGCTFGQGLTGLSTLSIGSLIAVAGIVAGGVAGVHYQTWRIDRSG
jgi:uncharacterized membrane protein YedE/YeeE